MKEFVEPKAHRHFVEDSQDYVLFSIVCERCDFVFMEFVHYIPPKVYGQDVSMYKHVYDPRDITTRNSQSWALCLMDVHCVGENLGHTVTPSSGAGMPSGVSVKSMGMKHSEFVEWCAVHASHGVVPPL